MRETNKKPSEIIAGALELFTKTSTGEDRERPAWIRGALQAGDRYCALGALSKVAYGVSAYPSDRDAYKDAADLVASCITSINIGTGASIPKWNDSLPKGIEGFKEVKKVFCKALNKALKIEEQKTRKRKPKNVKKTNARKKTK